MSRAITASGSIGPLIAESKDTKLSFYRYNTCYRGFVRLSIVHLSLSFIIYTQKKKRLTSE